MKKWGRGLFFLLSSLATPLLVRADPPGLIWRIAFKNGSDAIVRFAYEVPPVPHQIQVGDPTAWASPKAVAFPFTEAVLELLKIESETPGRSALIRLPAISLTPGAAEWMMEGLVRSLGELFKREGIEVNLTVIVDRRQSMEQIEAMIRGKASSDMKLLVERAEVVGPRSDVLRDWSAMPSVEQPFVTGPLLLNAPRQALTGEAIEIGEEISRAFSEIAARGRALGDTSLPEGETERDAMMQAARTLPLDAQVELRRKLAEIRKDCANLNISHDLISRVLRAVTASLREKSACDGALKQAS